MLRNHLTFSILFPLFVLLLVLVLVMSFVAGMRSVAPELRQIFVIVLGVMAAWIPVSVYLQIRRRILNPTRELRQKLQRACKGRPEQMKMPPHRDEIGDLVAGYNQMAASLTAERDENTRYEQEMRLQAQLVALGLQAEGLAHELASPLSAIGTLAKLASEGDAESMEHLRAETEVLKNRLNRFMGLFRERRVSVRPVRVGELVAARIRMLTPGRGVTLRFEPPADPVDVFSDAVLLSEVLDNLLQNAVRHARSVVHVEMEIFPSAVHVCVTDDGPGLSPAYAQKMFRPFFTTVEGGHGLGLFISRLWMQALGGQLEVASARHPKTGGASFRVVLPRKPGP